jgi:hypothetical protein
VNLFLTCRISVSLEDQLRLRSSKRVERPSVVGLEHSREFIFSSGSLAMQHTDSERSIIILEKQ